MTEPGTGAAGGAGALLRAARERQGLHIVALAAAIKVTPRKLEALEGDRYDELLDATFVRTLALSVCRTLKVDPAPVLERLPQAPTTGLARAGGSLNQPFRESGGHGDGHRSVWRRSPLLWAAGLLVMLAAAVIAMPERWWSNWTLPAWLAAGRGTAAPAAVQPSAADTTMPAAADAPAAGAAADAASAPAAVAVPPAVEVVHAAPPAEAGAGEAAAAGVAVLRATEPSWVEVVDAGGTVLLQRTLQPGEAVGLEGRLPLRLKIGNAAGMQLSLRGVPVDLAPSTRDNIARLELK